MEERKGKDSEARGGLQVDSEKEDRSAVAYGKRAILVARDEENFIFSKVLLHYFGLILFSTANL